jgi:hypothetical protein
MITRGRRTGRGGLGRCVDRCDDAAAMQQQDEGAPDKQALGHQSPRGNEEHVE